MSGLGHMATLDDFARARGDNGDFPDHWGKLTVITPALCDALNELLDVMEQEAAYATPPMLAAVVAIEALMPNGGRLAGGSHK